MFIYNIRQNLNQIQRLFLPHEPKSLLYTPFFGVCEMSYVIWVKLAQVEIESNESSEGLETSSQAGLPGGRKHQKGA